MSSATNPKTIVLSPEDGVEREAEASGDITPGQLVERVSGGKVRRHDDAGEAAQLAFAVEFRETGRGIDDDYVDGDQVKYQVLPEGVEVYAFLQEGENVTEGDELASNGNGNLKAAAAGDNIVAIAAEDVNASSGDTRVTVETAKGYITSGT